MSFHFNCQIFGIVCLSAILLLFDWQIVFIAETWSSKSSISRSQQTNKDFKKSAVLFNSHAFDMVIDQPFDFDSFFIFKGQFSKKKRSDFNVTQLFQSQIKSLGDIHCATYSRKQVVWPLNDHTESAIFYFDSVGIN